MKKTLTAAELLAKLNADPESVAQRETPDEAHLALESEPREAERLLVTALSRTGTSVTSVWDRVNTTRAYPEASPVLLEHLERPTPVPGPRVAQRTGGELHHLGSRS